MKKRYMAVVAMAAGLLMAGFVGPAQATLSVSGTVLYDGADRNLIYDSDLDITWLDYTKGPTSWVSQVAWAGGLSLTVNGSTYDDWRLPSTVDGQYVWGYDGTTTAGYNITNSEMGHLYYTELGNKGYQATDGSIPQPGWGLADTGPFTNLIASFYWSGTEYANNPNNAWNFNTNNGNQNVNNKDNNNYALAVRPGE